MIVLLGVLDCKPRIDGIEQYDFEDVQRFVQGARQVDVEAFAVQCVKDIVVERFWRVPLLLSNQGRRPLVPPLAARSEIRTEKRTFVANTSLGSNLVELNPGSELIGWVDCVLPADEVPHRPKLTMIGADHPPVNNIRS